MRLRPKTDGEDDGFAGVAGSQSAARDYSRLVPMTGGVLDNGWREGEAATTMWMGEWINGIVKLTLFYGSG